MGMPALSESGRWTIDLLETLPDDGNRYECIDGELYVTPPPATVHQWMVSMLLRLLGPYVDESGIGFTFTAPTGVEIDARTMVEPDVLVSRFPSSNRVKRLLGEDLVLAIEILSPTTARRDRGVKHALYTRIGVDEYWIVDIEERRVQCSRPGADDVELVTGQLTWHPAGASRPLVIDLPALFDAIPAVLREP
jgi:Uma2 family endonuclease